MIEYHRVKKYCDDHYNTQLKDTRIGLKLGIIGFLLLIYANIVVMNVSVILMIFEATLIVSYIIVLVLTYVFKDKRKLLRFIVTSIHGLTLMYGSFMTIYTGVTMPEYFYRFSQAFILIMIGGVMFSGVVKPYLNYIVGANILGYILVYSLVYGLDSYVLIKNFNLLIVAGFTIIFHYFFIESRVYEHEAVDEKNNKIEELKKEIIVRKQLQYQLKEMATYDGLTKAFTRAAGLKKLEKQMQETDKAFKSLAIIYLDVNGLKYINDTYGHKTGDKYIIALVDIINKHIKYKEFCVRLGGDEFLIVLPDTTYFGAEQLWRSINETIKLFDIEDDYSKVPLEVSHGIAEYTNSNYSSIEYFLDAADDKMYKDKKSSKMETLKDYM